jgi:hypothetical protein
MKNTAIGKFTPHSHVMDNEFEVATIEESTREGRAGYVGRNMEGGEYHVYSEFWSLERYEAAPFWDGEGLPPVGCECEFQNFSDSPWTQVRVIHYCGDEVWLEPLNGAQSFVMGNPSGFRPILSEEERQRQARIDTMNGFIDGFMKSSNGNYANLAAVLHDYLSLIDRLK